MMMSIILACNELVHTAYNMICKLHHDHILKWLIIVVSLIFDVISTEVYKKLRYFSRFNYRE